MAQQAGHTRFAFSLQAADLRAERLEHVSLFLQFIASQCLKSLERFFLEGGVWVGCAQQQQIHRRCRVFADAVMDLIHQQVYLGSFRQCRVIFAEASQLRQQLRIDRILRG